MANTQMERCPDCGSWEKGVHQCGEKHVSHVSYHFPQDGNCEFCRNPWHSTPAAPETAPDEEVVQEVLADGSMRMMSAKEAKKWRRLLKTKIRNESGSPRKEEA